MVQRVQLFMMNQNIHNHNHTNHFNLIRKIQENQVLIQQL